MGALDKLLDQPNKCPLAASSLYAIAALDAGASYINFTPSTGATPPAINELAVERGTRHAGRDGKTGETLLKSVLAPMFAHRNLEVMSWVGHNIFGNMDGQVLDDPANKKSKVASKDHLLPQILGYAPQTLVSIEYIAAWAIGKRPGSHPFSRLFGHADDAAIHLAGVRFAAGRAAGARSGAVCRARLAAGETGTLAFLASFFKEPAGDRRERFRRAIRHAACVGGRRGGGGPAAANACIAGKLVLTHCLRNWFNAPRLE